MPSTATDRLSGLSTSVAIKPPCRYATDGNITLSGLAVQAGGTWVTALSEDDRIMVKDQTDQTENGLYNASASGWARCKDFNGNRDVVQGTMVLVRPASSGTLFYEVTTANPIVIGTSNITFEEADPGVETLITRLASTASASDSAGMVRASNELNYAVRTIGWYETREFHIGAFQNWPVVGDGSDESTNINLIVDWLYARGSAAVLKFDAKTYGFGAAPLKFRSRIHYKGQGVGKTVLRGLGSLNVVGEATPATGHFYVEMSDMEIDGNRASVSFASDDAEGNAIRLNQITFSKFKNLFIHDSMMNGLSVYNNSHDNEFVDCRFADIGKTGTPPGAWTMCGIFFEAGSSRNKVVRPRINVTRQYGIWIGARDADNYDNEIVSPWISGAIADGIRIGDDATSNACYRPTIYNPTILAAGDIGIRLYHAATGSIVGAKILGGHVESCTTRGILIDTAAADTTVDGVTVKNNGSYGITVAGSNSDVRNCKVYGHSVKNVDDQSATTQLFSSTNNGTSDSQSGMFTPTVLLGGAAVGLTFTSRSGVYQREGRKLRGRISIVMLTKGSSTGNLTIGNLPVAAAASGPLGVANVTVASVTYSGIPVGLISNGASVIALYNQATGTTSTPLTDAALSNASEIYIDFEYDV